MEKGPKRPKTELWSLDADSVDSKPTLPSSLLRRDTGSAHRNSTQDDSVRHDNSVKYTDGAGDEKFTETDGEFSKDGDSVGDHPEQPQRRDTDSDTENSNRDDTVHGNSDSLVDMKSDDEMFKETDGEVSKDGDSVGGHPEQPQRRDTDSDTENSNRDDPLHGNSLVDMKADHERKPTEYPCEEINKRSLGKAIIRFCGNEGAENDDNQKSLRRLVQETISHVEKESPETLRNAEIKIYDDNCDTYTIKSGEGKHFFLATFDGQGRPQVVKTKRSNIESTTNKRCHIM